MDTKAEPDDRIENIAEGGEEEEELDDEEEEEDGEEPEEEPEVKPKGRRRRSILTGRGVTLSMLLDDGVIEPGEKCLSIAYLGQKFSADLMPDGRIKWPDAGKVFNSPSAWAIYCKRLVNPAKKSGCGWASVKYKGKKLDQYKSTWFRKQQPSDKVKKSPAQSLSGPSSSGAAVHSASVIKASASLSHTPKSIRTPGRPPNIGSLPGRPKGVGSASKSHSHGTPGHLLPSSSTSENRPLVSPRSSLSSPGQAAAHSTNTAYPYPQMSSAAHRSPTESALLPSMSSPPLSGGKQGTRSRLSVRYSSITPENDTKTLVELVSFSEIGRQAPFSVDISTNCLLLMDYHCHLTASEVVGYLAGKFDPQTHHMKILQAFPCRCRFADKGNAPKVEGEIQNAIIQRGLQVVGWYHSHPSYQPDPSIEDIRNQQKYQKTIGQWGTPYEPCVGIIISPYSKHKPSSESVFQAFWVLSPPEGQEDRLGMPMYLNITQQQDQFLSQDLLNELRWLWSFYKTCPDTINFNTTWFGNQSYLDKVKASLVKKFPTDQADGRFLEFINTLLT